jgi:hypothetical protein
MWLLYYDRRVKAYLVAKIPQNMTGEQFARRRGVIHVGNHDTREEAEGERRREAAVPGTSLARSDKVKVS